jgi:hypothetical protein
MSVVMALPATQEGLLGPRAQLLEVGLVSARAAAALRRVIANANCDDVDALVLRSATDMLITAADAMDDVSTGARVRHRGNQFGFGAMAFTVEVATQAATDADLSGFLRHAAESVEGLIMTPDPEVAEAVLPLFSSLADVATRQTGVVGEGAGSLIS